MRSQLSGASGSTSAAVDIDTYRVTDDKMVKERKKKADIAEKRRKKIMAQMSRMQKTFIQENADLFESTSTDLQRVASDMDVA